MKCSKNIFSFFAIINVFALLISAFGIYLEIKDTKDAIPYSPWLSLSIAITLLMRIPNQVCISFGEFYGWLTVIGTTMAIIAHSYISYLNYQIKNGMHRKYSRIALH